MKHIILNIPVLRDVAKLLYFIFVSPFNKFKGSVQYWEERYKSGKNSGVGSYAKFAVFKAEILNEFVNSNNIYTVIEYGCGDGNQLKLAKYPSYIGFDVSKSAIDICSKVFANDKTKKFKLMTDYHGEIADLCLSLDVIYHLVEDEVFVEYMNRLFSSSKRFVIVYSSNFDRQYKLQKNHIKHRKFTAWVEEKKDGWRLIKHIPNMYPYAGNDLIGSFADFYIFEST